MAQTFYQDRQKTPTDYGSATRAKTPGENFPARPGWFTQSGRTEMNIRNDNYQSKNRELKRLPTSDGKKSRASSQERLERF